VRKLLPQGKESMMKSASTKNNITAAFVGVLTFTTTQAQNTPLSITFLRALSGII
jgi:hypothetical protein